MKKKLIGVILIIAILMIIAKIYSNSLGNDREKILVKSKVTFLEEGVGGERAEKEVSDSIEKYVDNYYIADEGFHNGDKTDIASTFYGCLIAGEFLTDSEIEILKCRKVMEKRFIEELYEGETENADIEAKKMFAYEAYYYVMFKHTFDIEHIGEKEKNKITERLDDVLDSVLESENIDLFTARLILETKSNIDSYIYKDSYEKISAYLKSLKESENINSRYIDAIYIDYILETNVFSEEFSCNLVNKLYKEGMFMCQEGEVPDLKTTYHMYAVSSLVGNVNIDKNMANETKEYLENLCEDGIYRYSEKDTSVDLRSIYYGNALNGYIEVILEKGNGIEKR